MSRQNVQQTIRINSRKKPVCGQNTMQSRYSLTFPTGQDLSTQSSVDRKGTKNRDLQIVRKCAADKQDKFKKKASLWPDHDSKQEFSYLSRKQDLSITTQKQEQIILIATLTCPEYGAKNRDKFKKNPFCGLNTIQNRYSMTFPKRQDLSITRQKPVLNTGFESYSAHKMGFS